MLQPVAFGGCRSQVFERHLLVSGIVVELLSDRLLMDDADLVEQVDVVRNGLGAAMGRRVKANSGLSNQAVVQDRAGVLPADHVHLADPVAIDVPTHERRELVLEEIGHSLVRIENQDPVPGRALGRQLP